ncbi:MAG: hypothetical protein QNJ45_11565 [Ardenticatenaceae bacterium]|nr:hypothetical protein [Ardenticatenaceae bacterium]
MKFRKPRCVLVYALAPEGTKPPDANQAINAMSADQNLPLILWHDHFLGVPGGVMLFFVENEAERDALINSPHLAGWHVEMRPLIYSFNPAAFDEQIAYTMKAYRGQDWEIVRQESRPSYGNPREEVLSAEEEPSSR